MCASHVYLSSKQLLGDIRHVLCQLPYVLAHGGRGERVRVVCQDGPAHGDVEVFEAEPVHELVAHLPAAEEQVGQLAAEQRRHVLHQHPACVQLRPLRANSLDEGRQGGQVARRPHHQRPHRFGMARRRGVAGEKGRAISSTSEQLKSIECAPADGIVTFL